MKENFGGGMEIRIEDIGTAHKEGVNINAARAHIEAHQESELDGEALSETNRIVRDLSDLQNQYPDSLEIRDALAQLRNLVWKSEQATQVRVSQKESSNVPDPEKLLEEIEGLMHSSH
jgi:hypothetical protein